MPSADAGCSWPCSSLERLRKITRAAITEEFALYKLYSDIKKYKVQRTCMRNHICKLSHSLLTSIVYPQSVGNLMQCYVKQLMNFSSMFKTPMLWQLGPIFKGMECVLKIIFHTFSTCLTTLPVPAKLMSLSFHRRYPLFCQQWENVTSYAILLLCRKIQSYAVQLLFKFL